MSPNISARSISEFEYLIPLLFTWTYKNSLINHMCREAVYCQIAYGEVNLSRHPCRLELTSYVELALAPHQTDRAHPAFNKLFIETQWLPQHQALIARRRPRSPHDQPIWAAHLMIMESPPGDPPEFETDRARFLGRGHTLESPEAIGRTLTNSAGFVLDPIFSLRRRVTIAPNQRFQFSLVTMIAESREAVLGLIESVSDWIH